MNVGLDHKNALVCGSTQGIGKAIAIELAKCGASVTLMARNEDLLKKTVNELEGKEHNYLVADFSDFATVEAHREKIREGNYHILINNAGGPPPGPASAADWSEYEKALTMHLKVSHHLMQWVVPSMRNHQYGRIINVISTSVRIPIKGLGVSNTVRGGMASWSKSISNELAAEGITVNNILPGPIETQRLFAIIKGTAQKKGISEEASAAQMKETVPAGRFGKPEELGYLAAFLCSAYASYINGVSIPVDGGRTGSL